MREIESEIFFSNFSEAIPVPSNNRCLWLIGRIKDHHVPWLSALSCFNDQRCSIADCKDSKKLNPWARLALRATETVARINRLSWNSNTVPQTYVHCSAAASVALKRGSKRSDVISLPGVGRGNAPCPMPSSWQGKQVNIGRSHEW